MKNLSDLNPSVEAFLSYASFGVALWGALFGGKGHDDKDIIECHDEVLEALCDADRTNTVAELTDRNWRKDVTIEQAIQMNEEREEARWWWKKG